MKLIKDVLIASAVILAAVSIVFSMFADGADNEAEMHYLSFVSYQENIGFNKLVSKMEELHSKNNEYVAEIEIYNNENAVLGTKSEEILKEFERKKIDAVRLRFIAMIFIVLSITANAVAIIVKK